jgi:hypothetical protein
MLITPAYKIHAAASRHLNAGRPKEGCALLEKAVLQKIQAKRFARKDFPLLIKLVRAYSSSGILSRECAKTMYSERKDDLQLLLLHASDMADQLMALAQSDSSPLTKAETFHLGAGLNPELAHAQSPAGIRELSAAVAELNQIVEAAATAPTPFLHRQRLPLPSIQYFNRTLSRVFSADSLPEGRELIEYLLALEKKALFGNPKASVAVEPYRKKMLALLDPAQRGDYLDFLFSLGNACLEIDRFTEAEAVFSQIAAIPGEKSREVLLLLAKAQTRLEIELGPEEKLAALVEPILIKENFWGKAVRDIFEILVRRRISAATAARIISGPHPERMERLLPELFESGQIDHLFSGTQEVFTSFEGVSPGLGRKAAEIYLICRMHDLRHSSRKAAEKKRAIDEMLDDAVLQKYIARETEKALRNEAREADKFSRQAAKRESKDEQAAARAEEMEREKTEFSSFLGRFTDPDQPRMELSICRKMARYCEQTAGAGEAVVAACKNMLAQGEVSGSALLLAALLFENRHPRAQEILGLIRSALESEEKIFTRVTSLIIVIRNNLNKAAESVPAESASGGINIDNAAISKDDYFIGHQLIHDLIFVRLRESAAARRCCAEITGVPYATPHSLTSLWYYILGLNGNSRQKIRLYKKSIEADPRHLSPRINLALALLEQDRESEANVITNDLLSQPPLHPLLHLKLNGIKAIVQFCRLKKAKSAGEKQPVLEQMRALCRQTQALFSAQEGSNFYENCKGEWRGILSDYFRQFTAAHALEPALECFRQLHDLGCADPDLIQTKAMLLLEFAQYRQLEDFLLPILSDAESRFKDSDSRPIAPALSISNYLNYLSEAEMQRGNYSAALAYLHRINYYLPNAVHLQGLVSRVRLQIYTGDLPGAEGGLIELDHYGMISQLKEPSSTTVYELRGTLDLVRAELSAKKGDPEKAREKFRSAVENLANAPEAHYREMEGRFRYVEFLNRWAADLRAASSNGSTAAHDLSQEALKEGRLLTDKFPYFPPARQALLTAEIALGMV